MKRSSLKKRNRVSKKVRNTSPSRSLWELGFIRLDAPPSMWEKFENVARSIEPLSFFKHAFYKDKYGQFSITEKQIILRETGENFGNEDLFQSFLYSVAWYMMKHIGKNLLSVEETEKLCLEFLGRGEPFPEILSDGWEDLGQLMFFLMEKGYRPCLENCRAMIKWQYDNVVAGSFEELFAFNAMNKKENDRLENLWKQRKS